MNTIIATIAMVAKAKPRAPRQNSVNIKSLDRFKRRTSVRNLKHVSSTKFDVGFKCRCQHSFVLLRTGAKCAMRKKCQNTQFGARRTGRKPNRPYLFWPPWMAFHFPQNLITREDKRHLLATTEGQQIQKLKK